MTLAQCWRMAVLLEVSDHAVERYFQRSTVQAAATGADVEELVRAELVRSWGDRHHFRDLLEEGAHRRIAVIWNTEHLVTIIRPAGDEGRPVALTVLTQAMFDESCSAGRYWRAAA